MIKRHELISSNHNLKIENYLDELRSKKRLLYNGKPTYQKGTEFLASNEFDWYKTIFDAVETESAIGFGTNSLWDISVRDQAKAMVIADWSPWPLIAHAFIFSPLLRVTNSPQEFIYTISGLPPKYSYGRSLSDAFDLAKKFTLSKIDEQKLKVLELLTELSADPSISDLELKFLTTFFRPRLGDNLHQQNGFGPFYDLKNQNTANLTFYLEQRYNPKNIGQTASALSNLENFNYLKSLFQTHSVYYALAEVTDINFYKAVLQHQVFKNHRHFSISLSNIFECGHYNNLNLINMAELINRLKTTFEGKNVLIYRTTGRSQPYDYLREVLL